MSVAQKYSILADHCSLRTAVNRTLVHSIRRIRAFRFFLLPNFQNKLPKPVVKLLISDFFNVRIDFVAFLFAAILFNFYIAFDDPFLPATYRPRSINFRVCRYSGLSPLLDFYHKQQQYYAQDVLSFRLQHYLARLLLWGKRLLRESILR